jgi:catechol 2,3-dioxygenase-like lactoylglutathione lyase family enzyme
MAEQDPTLTGCHVELHVAELGAARKFYVDKLGLAVLQETPPISLLAVRIGSIRLSIFGDRKDAHQVGPVHLVLGTPDLARQIVILEARGVRFDGPVVEAPGFCRFVQTRDPDGNLVEIAQYLRDPLTAA